MPFDQLRIGTRLILAFGGITLIVAVLVGMGLSRISRAEDAYRGALSSLAGASGGAPATAAAAPA